MGCSGRCKRDACFLSESDNPPSTSFGNIQADKVSALGPSPGDIGHAAKFLAEDVEHLLKFWRNQDSVPLHQLQDASLVLQKANVTQLIDLVRTNCPWRKSCEQPLNVVFRGCKGG